MPNLDDTIAAVATAPGAAGLAVVRVSGPRALAVAAAVFEGADLRRAPGGTLHHGWARRPASVAGTVEGPDDRWAGRVPAGSSIASRAEPAPAGGPAGTGAEPAPSGGPGRPQAQAPPSGGPGGAGAEPAPATAERIDEVVAAVFRAPRSYTREDVVEISCHGGGYAARALLEALLAAGARPADPGEFTMRAFLHGRLDLVQAEAVADLIAAESSAAHALALSQLRGDLSRALAATAEALREALAEIEARVDFAEDVGGVEVPPEVAADLARERDAVAAWLAGAARSRAAREGVHVALIGRPNAGKSSVFNALLGERRAIVASLPGTTRDLVSEALELRGVRVTLSDTAGLRSGGDEVESEGVERAREALERSAAVLWIVDASVPTGAEDARIAAALAPGPARARPACLVALNKIDLPRRVAPAEVGALAPGARVVEISALRGDGIEDLRSALAEQVAGPRGFAGAVANPRHLEALARVRDALERAAAAAAARQPGEIVALELREALLALGEVTGETAGEDLLERIFRRFCVGK